jgi:DNA-binding MarR family transcriptional regulator
MRESREDGNAAILRTRLRVVRETLGRDPARMSDCRLSQSLMAGLLILAAMPSDGSYVANAQIARMLGMNPSTAHRYVSTLVAVDLLERHPGTRRYRLV